MARASTPTLLSLDRFAQITGIHPTHFNGAHAGTVFPLRGFCTQVWPQYAWQTSEAIISREELAFSIYNAEQDIKNLVGYSPAPTWESDESHRMQATRHGYGGRTAKQVATTWKKVIAPGMRALDTLELDAVVAYSDEDHDGFFETATVTVSATVDDVREVKLYFAGREGAPEWEIRPIRTRTAANGDVILVLDSWLLVLPELWDAYPTADGFRAIDISDLSNLVDLVDVFREYNDASSPGAALYWAKDNSLYSCTRCSGAGCPACQVTAQDGCFAIFDPELGLVLPYPATYAGGVWSRAAYSEPREPERVTLNYQAGLVSQRYRSGASADPLEDYMAQAIAWLAAARLTKPVCGCGNVDQYFRSLQADATANEGVFRSELMDMFVCPLGHRVGEVMAWQRLGRVLGDVVMQGGGI
jgi:hypothetical protein